MSDETAPISVLDDLPEPIVPPEPECPYAYLAPPDSYLKIVRVFTFYEALQTRLPNFRTRKCILIYPLNQTQLLNKVSTQYLTGSLPPWERDNNHINLTTTYSIEDAVVATVRYVLEQRNNISNEWLIAMLDEAALAKMPRKRKFVFEKVLNPTLVALAQVAPKNPVVRAHMLSLFNAAPPPEIETWVQLKEWAEYGFEPPYLGVPGREQYRIPDPEARRRNAPATTNYAFHVACEAQTEVKGIAQFKGVRKGTLITGINREIMLDMINSRKKVSEIMSAITSICQNFKQEVDYVEGDFSDAQYEGHEVEAHGETAVTIQSEAIKLLVEEFIKNNYGTQEAKTILER